MISYYLYNTDVQIYLKIIEIEKEDILNSSKDKKAHGKVAGYMIGTPDTKAKEIKGWLEGLNESPKNQHLELVNYCERNGYNDFFLEEL